MGNPLRLGILGCADVVRRLMLPALRATTMVALETVASRDSAKARDWSRQFGCRAACDYDEILKDPLVDAVYIPLPTSEHTVWVGKAARAGKHVICEKPLSGSLSAAHSIVEACRKNGVVLFENLACGQHPQHEAVAGLVRSYFKSPTMFFKGSFGFPHRPQGDIRYRRDLDGGALNDAGVYPIFLARKLFAREPLEVRCHLYADPRWDVDIAGVAQMDFSDGAAAQVSFGMGLAYQNQYEIWGDAGRITLNRAYSIPADHQPELSYFDGRETQRIDVPAADQFRLTLEAFYHAVTWTATVRKARYESILCQAQVLDALRRSAHECRSVRLSEMAEVVA